MNTKIKNKNKPKTQKVVRRKRLLKRIEGSINNESKKPLFKTRVVRRQKKLIGQTTSKEPISQSPEIPDTEEKKLDIQYKFTPIEQEKWQKKLQNLIDLREHQKTALEKEKYYEAQLPNKPEEEAILALKPKQETIRPKQVLLDPIVEYKRVLKNQKELKKITNYQNFSQIIIMLLSIVFITLVVVSVYNIFIKFFFSLLS